MKAPRHLLLGLMLALALREVRAADAGGLVELPPFLVEEAAKGPPWRYTEVPGYEILSRCSDATTRAVVTAHWRLHQLLSEILPERLQFKIGAPRAWLIYDEELQPAASKEIVAKLMNPSGKNAARDVELDLPGGRRRIVVARPRYTFAPNLRLFDPDAMAVFMIVRSEGLDVDRLALTENYVNYLVRNRVPALPPWFVAGFTVLYQGVEFDGDELKVKPVEWISRAITHELKSDPKKAPPLLPLADFFTLHLTPTDPQAGFTAAERWRSQATVFLHWALDGDGAPRREGLFKFADRAAIEGTSEKLFRECFGMDFAEADRQLAAYLPTAVHRTIRFAPKLPRPPELVLRNASEGQIARIKGQCERLEIDYVKALQPDLASKYADQAWRTLLHAYDHDERDSRLLAELGLLASDTGDDARASAFLEAGTRIGPMRARADYELARLRFAALRKRPDTAAGLNAAQMASVLTPLFAARAQEPPLAAVYELIAEVWAHSAVPPRRGHLLVLDEGARLFPRDSLLLERAARLYLAHGFRAEARAMAQLGARTAEDDATRERFVALQGQIGK